MITPKNQTGFSVFEIIMLIATVALLGLAGYLVYDRQQEKAANNKSGQSTTQNVEADRIPEAPEIKSTSDLSNAEKVVDETSVESSQDNADLDAELSSF